MGFIVSLSNHFGTANQWTPNNANLALLGVLNHSLHPDTPGGTPENSWWGVPPGSPNPDPTKNVLFHTRFQTILVFRPGL